jgi:hypothetical protein
MSRAWITVPETSPPTVLRTSAAGGEEGEEGNEGDRVARYVAYALSSVSAHATTHHGQARGDDVARLITAARADDTTATARTGHHLIGSPS